MFISGPPFILKNFILLTWTDENGQTETLRLRDEMSSKWQDVGLLLDLSASRLDGILAHRLGDVRQCCRDVLQEWISCGSSDYPPTWEGLLRLLRKGLSLNSCANSLERALKYISS